MRAVGWLMRSGIFEIMFLDGRVAETRVSLILMRNSLNPKSKIQNPKLNKSTPMIAIEESNAARKRQCDRAEFQK